MAVSTSLILMLSAGVPLPEGNQGLAASYVGDIGLGSNANVLRFDNFEEEYGPTNPLSSKWNVNGDTRLSSAAAHGGTAGVEFRIPNSPTAEVGAGITLSIPGQNVVFLRYYSKFDSSFGVWGSSHNGASVSSSYWVGPGSGPGIKADGYNKFHVGIENAYLDPNGSPSGIRQFLDTMGFTTWQTLPSPGVINAYVYWPEQRSIWGDHWYPNGKIIPFDPSLGNNNSFTGFTPRPNIVPQLDRWYCWELMVKANTCSAVDNCVADGRVAFWLDGALIVDWPNLTLRKTPVLTMDLITLGLHANPNPAPATKKFVDDVVIATQYIGPKMAPNPPPSSPSGLVVL